MTDIMDLTGGGGGPSLPYGPGSLKDKLAGTEQAQDTNGMLQGIMPMLVQYMSAAGADIGAGKPLGANVNAATKQNLAAQSQAKILQKILAGGGKISVDKNKFNISGEPGMLKEGGVFGGGEATGTGASTGAGSAAGESSNVPQTGTSFMSQLLQGNINPNPPASPLGNINANDLVGLTPENISGALALKQHQDKLTQESINSRFDNLLKLSQASKLMDDDKKTAEIRNYEYAVKSGFKGSFDDWSNVKDSTDWKNYLKVKSEGIFKGSFFDYQKELANAKSTKISVGESAEKAAAVADATENVKHKKYFESPEFTAGVDKHIASDAVQDKLIKSGPPGNLKRNKAEAAEKIEYIKSKISAKGDIVDMSLQGRTIVFKVKWNDGTTGEVRYAN